MTATPSIDPALTRTLDPGEFLHDQLAQAPPDLMRELLATFVNALLGADADAICAAASYNRTPKRVNSRNGYRHRDLDTRDGTIDVAIPKLRWPSWKSGSMPARQSSAMRRGKHAPPSHWPSGSRTASRRAPHPSVSTRAPSAATWSGGASVRSRSTCHRIAGSPSSSQSMTSMAAMLRPGYDTVSALQ